MSLRCYWLRLRRVGFTLFVPLLAAPLAACITPPIHAGPGRLIPVEDELAIIKSAYADAMKDYSGASVTAKAQVRNDIITARMYAIDLEYTAYANALANEARDEGFVAAVASAGLTGTASLIPVAQTSRLLSGIATGINAAHEAYDKNYLANYTIQVLLTQMHTNRNLAAATLTSNMTRSVSEYPLGAALSDLEAYYRAGTITEALVGLTTVTGDQANTSQALRNQLAPGGATLNAAMGRVSALSGRNQPVQTANRTNNPNRVRPLAELKRIEQKLTAEAHQSLTSVALSN